MKQLTILMLILVIGCQPIVETIYIQNHTNETIYIYDNSTSQCPTCEVCNTSQCPEPEDPQRYKERIQNLQVRLLVCEDNSRKNFTLVQCEAELDVLKGKYNDSVEKLEEIYEVLK